MSAGADINALSQVGQLSGRDRSEADRAQSPRDVWVSIWKRSATPLPTR